MPKEPKEELELRCARSPRAPPTGKDLMVVTDMTSSFGEFWGDMARCVATGGSKRRDEPLKGTDRALASLVVVRAERGAASADEEWGEPSGMEEAGEGGAVVDATGVLEAGEGDAMEGTREPGELSSSGNEIDRPWLEPPRSQQAAQRPRAAGASPIMRTSPQAVQAFQGLLGERIFDSQDEQTRIQAPSFRGCRWISSHTVQMYSAPFSLSSPHLLQRGRLPR